jgi:hypothetical protein
LGQVASNTLTGLSRSRLLDIPLQDPLDLLVLKDPLDLRAMRVPKDRKVKLVRKATLGTSDLRDHKDLREQIRLLLDRKAILERKVK